jgi:hypothetical protein
MNVKIDSSREKHLICLHRMNNNKHPKLSLRYSSKGYRDIRTPSKDGLGV